MKTKKFIYILLRLSKKKKEKKKFIRGREKHWEKPFQFGPTSDFS